MTSGGLGMAFATFATTGKAPVEIHDAIEREIRDFADEPERVGELKSLQRYVRRYHPIPKPFRWQWCQGDEDITADPWCESYADEARAWYGAHGDDYAIVAKRTKRGRWAIDSFGGGAPLISWFAKRFYSPDDALDWYGQRRGWKFQEAVCRCGDASGAECD